MPLVKLIEGRYVQRGSVQGGLLGGALSLFKASQSVGRRVFADGHVSRTLWFWSFERVNGLCSDTAFFDGAGTTLG